MDECAVFEGICEEKTLPITISLLKTHNWYLIQVLFLRGAII